VPLALLLAAAPLAPAQADDAVDREVDVYLHEPLHIAPPRIDVKQGETVRLNVKNYNPNPHDLVVCGDAPGTGSGCDERWGYVGVEPNGEAALTFTAARAGTFEYFCTIPGHKQGGMRGELVVQGTATTKETPGPGVPLALALLGAAALLARRTRAP
jgi:MYXO-CTERM domain-containing protein